MEVKGRKKILVADDTDALMIILPRLSKNLPYDYVGASSVNEAIAKINSHKPDMVISDYNLPISDTDKGDEGEGKKIVLEAQTKGIPVILSSGTEKVAEVAKNLKVPVPFVPKSAGVPALLKVIDQEFKKVSGQQASQARY